MNTLYDIEKQFNEIYNIDKLIVDSINIISEIRADSNSAIYDDCSSEDIIDIQNAEIIYTGKVLLMNYNENPIGGPIFMPRFYLSFMLKGKNKKYSYDIEYSLSGEYIDDYFEIPE